MITIFKVNKTQFRTNNDFYYWLCYPVDIVNDGYKEYFVLQEKGMFFGS